MMLDRSWDSKASIFRFWTTPLTLHQLRIFSTTCDFKCTSTYYWCYINGGTASPRCIQRFCTSTVWECLVKFSLGGRYTEKQVLFDYLKAFREKSMLVFWNTQLVVRGLDYIKYITPGLMIGRYFLIIPASTEVCLSYHFVDTLNDYFNGLTFIADSIKNPSRNCAYHWWLNLAAFNNRALCAIPPRVNYKAILSDCLSNKFDLDLMNSSLLGVPHLSTLLINCRIFGFFVFSQSKTEPVHHAAGFRFFSGVRTTLLSGVRFFEGTWVRRVRNLMLILVCTWVRFFFPGT